MKYLTRAEKEHNNYMKFCVTKLKKGGFIEKHRNRIAKSKIDNLYKSAFNSNPKEDYEKYLELLKSKSSGYIYVIGNTKAGVCKIGYTKNVFKRIKEIQTGCPFPLEIICVVNGSTKEEKSLHKKYHKFRMSGEWFKYEGDLKINIERVESVISDSIILNKKPLKVIQDKNIAHKEIQISYA